MTEKESEIMRLEKINIRMLHLKLLILKYLIDRGDETSLAIDNYLKPFMQDYKTSFFYVILAHLIEDKYIELFQKGKNQYSITPKGISYFTTLSGVYLECHTEFKEITQHLEKYRKSFS